MDNMLTCTCTTCMQWHKITYQNYTTHNKQVTKRFSIENKHMYGWNPQKPTKQTLQYFLYTIPTSCAILCLLLVTCGHKRVVSGVQGCGVSSISACRAVWVPGQDLATPHLMCNCGKRILSLHCTLYVCLCMYKVAATHNTTHNNMHYTPTIGAYMQAQAYPGIARVNYFEPRVLIP